MTIDAANHLPAIGLKSGRRVITEPAAHITINGNPVVIIKDDQLSKAKGAGE